jgi:hypothetical protein
MSSFIKIKKLSCVQLNNRDEYECQVEILIDRSIKQYLQMRLTEGQSWSSNDKYYKFENQVEVRILDKNDQENECFSGLVNLELYPVDQNLETLIDNETGYYILGYRIELEKPPELLPRPKFPNGKRNDADSVGSRFPPPDGIPSPVPTPD